MLGTSGTKRMKLVKRSACLLLTGVGLAIGSGCRPKASTNDSNPNPQPKPPLTDPVRGHLLQAQPKLPTLKVWLGSEELITEIAREPVQIATGMMFRTNMAENTAMLFVFPGPGPRSFYMRNCVVPLSAAYIEPDGTIAEIVDLHPGDEVGVPSRSSNVQFVLEVPQGWFSRHNVTTGAVVRTEQGSLRETFFRRR
ncbi:MAG: DUF192 domain-containing protein [Verrucomicrobia bacterium]|nr:DUF192 domain-containing protein [Verrucomicrobiota bacterium]